MPWELRAKWEAVDRQDVDKQRTNVLSQALTPCSPFHLCPLDSLSLGGEDRFPLTESWAGPGSEKREQRHPHVVFKSNTTSIMTGTSPLLALKMLPDEL
jgi:hypothetical protein